MKLSPDQELENAQIKVSYFKVCSHFGLTETEALNPNAGDWLVDVIKQSETALSLFKAMKLRSNENQKVETYKSPIPMPPKPNILEQFTDTLTGGQDGRNKEV